MLLNSNTGCSVNTDITVVKASHLMPFISFLDGKGAPVEQLLSKVNLHREFFSHPENLVAEAPFWAFLELAAESQGIADLGFQVTEKLSLDSFGVFGAKVMQAKTLQYALSTFIADMGQQSNCPPFWLKENEHGLWFYRLGTQGIKKGHWVVEQHVVSMMIQLVRGFTSKGWTSPCVHLQSHTLIGAENTASFKKSQVFINKSYTGIFIPNALLLNKPISREKAISKEILTKKTCIGNVNSKVLKALISQSSYTRAFSVEQTAQALAMSVRQLQRLLKQENISFRELSEQVLFERAKILLNAVENSVLDIAFELGYSDAGNFSRAFKRWSGESPSQYRLLVWA